MRKVQKDSSEPNLPSKSVSKQKKESQSKKVEVKSFENSAIVHFKYVMTKLLSKKKSEVYDKVKRNSLNKSIFLKNVHRFSLVLNSLQKNNKKQCLNKLKVNKIKQQPKANSCILMANSLRRILERKKTLFYAISKACMVKNLRNQKATMALDNQKYKQNVFSETLVNQVKKVMKINPQNNLNVFIQYVQQNLLPTISQQTYHLQSKRRKKNQASQNQSILGVLNSLSICLINMNRNHKTISEQSKELKDSLSSLKNFQSIVEQIDKFDKEFLKKNDTQLKKIVENQIKVCEKKKNTNYLFESRCNLLQMLSKSLSNNQKSDPNKQITQKLQILSQTCTKPLELQSFKINLKQIGNPVQKHLFNISGSILNLHKGVTKQDQIKEQNIEEDPVIVEEVNNLSRILQRINQGKLFESGKKSSWKNVFKNVQKQQTPEIESIYENIGKFIQIIEAKDNRIEELVTEVEKTQKIFTNLIRVLNDQNEKVEKDWHSLQEENVQKKQLFLKLNEGLEHHAALSSDRQNNNQPRQQIGDTGITEHEAQIRYLNNLIQEQELVIYSLEQENIELRSLTKKQEHEDIETIRDLTKQIEQLMIRNIEKERKMQRAKSEFSKFKYNFKIHEQQLRERKKQVSAIMKSPKNAKSTIFSRHQSQTIIIPYQSLDLDYDILKEENQNLYREVERLHKSLKGLKSNITADNMITLIYNLITVSFRISNQTVKAKELWNILLQVKKYFIHNPLEGLMKTQNKVTEWITKNIGNESNTQIMDSLLMDLNKLMATSHADQITPKKKGTNPRTTDEIATARQKQ